MGESNVAQFHGFLFVTVVNMSVVKAIAKSSPSHSGINVELAKTFPQKKTWWTSTRFCNWETAEQERSYSLSEGKLKKLLKLSMNVFEIDCRLSKNFFFYKYKWSVCLICSRIDVRSYDDANHGGIFPTCVKLEQHQRKCSCFQIDLWAFFLVNRDKRTFKGK